MTETINRRDPWPRVIDGVLAGLMALGHAAAALMFYFVEGKQLGAGLQALGAIIWVGVAIWEFR